MAGMREATSIPRPSPVPRPPHLPAAAAEGWGPEEGPFDLRLLLIVRWTPGETALNGVWTAASH